MIPVLYPMGAKKDPKREEKAWDDRNWWAERKYDGSRYLIRIEADGEVRVVSRQESKVTGLPVDKTENVPHLVAWVRRMGFPENTILDGEIITHENCNSNEVTSIMGSSPEEAIRKQEERGYVKYVVFDMLYYDGRNLLDQPYRYRRQALEILFRGLTDDEYVFLTEVANYRKKDFYNEIVDKGGEGVILKHVESTYVPGEKPVGMWLKVKKYDTYDVVVIGFTEPTRRYTGDHEDTWPYWELENGHKFAASGKAEAHNCAAVADMPVVPVTKDYFMGWIGAVRFAQWVPDNSPLAVAGKEHFGTEIIGGMRHWLMEIGQTDGLKDDVKVIFTDRGHDLIGTVIEVGAMEQISKTGALRHPRFVRFRDDKSSEQCILGEC